MSEFPAGVASKIESGTDVFEFTPSQVSGETFVVGDLVVWDAANDWVERAGANPTAILGISEVSSEDARLITPNGKVPIRTLTEKAIVALSSATTLSEATHRLGEYGITRSSGGKWQLDPAKTGGDARVVVLDVDTGTNTAFCKFLSEFLSADGIDS